MAGIIGTISQAHEVREKLLNRQAGKWLLSQNNPNEFEYYMVALELLKSDLTTKKYFIFPVNPNSIEYNDTKLTKITKTAGGISVLKNTQFNIKDISISGTFGNNFKVLMGEGATELRASYDEEENQFNLKESLNKFSNSVKTGYGCTKILEDIVNTTTKRDEFGGSHFLVLYNLAFNQRLLVEIDSVTFNQSLDSNTIWNYSIQFKVIGDSDNFLKGTKEDYKSNKQLVLDGVVQQNANTTYTKVSGIVNSSYNMIFK